MDRLDLIANRSTRTLNFVSCILLLAMMGFIVVYILLRGVFGYIIFASYEIVQYTCLFVVCCALAGNDYKEGNVRITVLTDLIPEKWRVLPDSFALLLSCAASIATTCFMFVFYIRRLAIGSVTLNLHIPVSIFAFALFVSFILLSFSVVVRTIRYFRRHERKTEQDEDVIIL